MNTINNIKIVQYPMEPKLSVSQVLKLYHDALVHSLVKLITFQGKTFYCNGLVSHDGVQEQVATLIPE